MHFFSASTLSDLKFDKNNQNLPFLFFRQVLPSTLLPLLVNKCLSRFLDYFHSVEKNELSETTKSSNINEPFKV